MKREQFVDLTNHSNHFPEDCEFNRRIVLGLALLQMSSFSFSERISDEAGGGRSKSNNNVILNRERGLYLNIKAELNNYKENVQTFEKGNKVH